MLQDMFEGKVAIPQDGDPLTTQRMAQVVDDLQRRLKMMERLNRDLSKHLGEGQKLPVLGVTKEELAKFDEELQKEVHFMVKQNLRLFGPSIVYEQVVEIICRHATTAAATCASSSRTDITAILIWRGKAWWAFKGNAVDLKARAELREERVPLREW